MANPALAENDSSRLSQLGPDYDCPACGHGDLAPGLAWDHNRDCPTVCPVCEGDGCLTHEQLRELARETEHAELQALVAERDPALTWAELGFTSVDEVAI